MEQINERIAYIISELKIKKTVFAERLHISQAFVSQLCLGVKQPSDRTIADICREFNVSEVWLRTGEGEPFNQLDEDAEFVAICEAISLSDDDIIKKIIKSYWGLDEKEKAAIRKLIDGLCK